MPGSERYNGWYNHATWEFALVCDGYLDEIASDFVDQQIPYDRAMELMKDEVVSLAAKASDEAAAAKNGCSPLAQVFLEFISDSPLNIDYNEIVEVAIGTRSEYEERLNEARESRKTGSRNIPMPKAKTAVRKAVARNTTRAKRGRRRWRRGPRTRSGATASTSPLTKQATSGAPCRANGS